MRIVCRLLAALVPLALLTTSLHAEEKKAEAKDKKRILLITESKGFVHEVVKRPKPDEDCLVEKTFKDIAAQTGTFEVVCSQDSRTAITAENLAKFDAVFFYTTGELPLSDTQKADLIAFVKKGGGFGGTHSATDTFYKWAEYGDLIGGYFDGHPWTQKITVLVEDRKHPATRHLPESFEIDDEIYQFRGPYSREKLHILMRMDVKSVNKTGKRTDNDYALAWTHEYGKGRVFYTALGHRPQVWKDERFQKMLIGGLRYITRLEDADATPTPLPKTGGEK
jgi:type 1 glutamine amidotransferase